MGDHVYFNKHSSAAKGISCHTKHQFMDMGAPQARPNNRAYAGPRTAQVTATQWLIFNENFHLRRVYPPIPFVHTPKFR